MRDTKQIVIINGRESEIFYRESRSTEKGKPNIYNLATLKTLEELLTPTGISYPKGITTLKTLTSYDEQRLKIKRISNRIVELRKITPKSGILTFKYLDDSFKEWRYGVINEKEIIDFLKKLREQIALKLNESDREN